MKNSMNSLNYRQVKGRDFLGQLELVYKAFKQKPMTMKEADAFTGIMRENICRYVKTMMDQGRLAIIRKRKCTITGYDYVNEYTANPDLFPECNQLRFTFEE